MSFLIINKILKKKIVRLYQKIKKTAMCSLFIIEIVNHHLFHQEEKHKWYHQACHHSCVLAAYHQEIH